MSAADYGDRRGRLRRPGSRCRSALRVFREDEVMVLDYRVARVTTFRVICLRRAVRLVRGPEQTRARLILERRPSPAATIGKSPDNDLSKIRKDSNTG